MYEKIAARKSVPQLYEQKLTVSTFLWKFICIIPIILDSLKAFFHLRALPKCAMNTRPVSNLSSPKHLPMRLLLPCWRISGRASFGQQAKMPSIILRLVLNMIFFRKSVMRVSLFLMAS